MKLMIGENIRKYRKELGLTQEQLADRLGVTYQSISRWENGSTYPDMEFLPAIAETFSITIDKLLGMPESQKQRMAKQAFDDLQRECLKPDYDSDKIVALLQDIRRNYMDDAIGLWCSGNERVFSDPKILPEVRKLAQLQLERTPRLSPTIKTMAIIEDEEHINEFLDKHSAITDCTKSTLLYFRYMTQMNKEKFEPERRYKLYRAICDMLIIDNLVSWDRTPEECEKACRFRLSLLELVRSEGSDTEPDMWLGFRIGLWLDFGEQLAKEGKTEEALEVLTKCVRLFENTMSITDEIPIPTSCPWLEGMKWTAREEWRAFEKNPDSPEERNICVSTSIDQLISCNFVFPSRCYSVLTGKGFSSLRDNAEFISLAERVKALIVTREKK